jgi:hypothetical protein
MSVRELLLWGLVGWTAIGAVGTTVSFAKFERAKAMRNLGWILGVWVVYLGVLIGVSLRQKQRVVAIGQQQCFDAMCFTVTRVDEIPELPVQNGRLLIRVMVRVRNRSHEHASDGRMQVYLVDAQGRQWGELPGLSGVRLTTDVPAGDSILSEPVFGVAADATGLNLVFTQGKRQPGVLTIGDSDSLLHQRTVVPLSR